MPMNQEIKARWVAWLRANVDEQGIGHLRNDSDGTFCCLGGLCELAVADGLAQYDQNTWTYGPVGHVYGTSGEWDGSTLPKVVYTWAELTNVKFSPDNPFVLVPHPQTGVEVEECLAELNDSWDEYDFNKIADVIEAQL